MDRKQFVDQIRDDEITAAIASAEKQTSGEIRVFVSHHSCPDPMRTAQRHFHHLGMAHTRHRNGILIFVAPASRTFALVGDHGIHQKCGEDFWQALRNEMIPHFQSGRYTEGIVHAIAKAGDLLVTHFPNAGGEHKNELPDKVERD
jgi:uncharacterized membrane protein